MANAHDGAKHGRSGFPLAVCVATLACLAAIWAGQASGGFHGGAPPVMPMTGVSIAALLIGGKRLWPAIILGFLLIIPLVGTPDPLAMRVLAAASMAMGALVSVILIERIGGSARAENVWAILVGTGAGTALMAAAGTAIGYLSGNAATPDIARAIFAKRMIGHFVGTLVTLPLILAWARSSDGAWRAERAAHFVILLLLTSAASWAVFLRHNPGPIAWAVYPMLIWAALAFRVRGAAAASTIASLAALLGTPYGLGPFGGHGGAAPFTLTAQLFVATTQVMMLIVATLAHERRSEAQLRRDSDAALARATEAETRPELAQQAAGIGVWEASFAARGAFHTVQSERLFDLEPKDGAIRHAEDFGDRMSDAHKALLFDSIVRARETHGRCDFEVAITLRDGTLRWLRNVGRFDASGGANRVLGMVMDVTAKHEAEARLEAAHDRLLQISRLSAMGAMASTLAHELNQPLSAIANYAAASRRQLERADAHAHAATIEMLQALAAESLRAGKIIRKMRDFTLRGVIVREASKLGGIVDAACTSVRRLPDAANVAIHTRLDPSADQVEVDPVQIEQVIANIVMNGVEATAGCAIRQVDISSHQEGRDVVITVADTGSGLPPQLQENLFEPFRTSKQGGTGLGLSICRTIVEGHGGRLWAEQPALGGAVFRISLPAVGIHA